MKPAKPVQETREQALRRLQREREAQHQAELNKRRQMAEEYFAEPKVTPTVPSDRRREIAGIKVSDNAYRLHSFFVRLHRGA